MNKISGFFALAIKHFLRGFCLLFFICVFQKTFASAIVIDTRDAVVWLNKQTISGRLTGFKSNAVIVNCNGNLSQVSVMKNGRFSFVLFLAGKKNLISVFARDNQTTIVSDTLKLTLGYTPLPAVKPYATVRKNRVTLHASVLTNPMKKRLTFFWTADARNPAKCTVVNNQKSSANVVVPSNTGIYYFNLLVVAGGDSAWFQTFVKKTDSSLLPFDMEHEYADWIDTAVMYEITPAYFVKNGTYDDIRNKLHEIKSLGINTIWLQPVYKNADGGQGYGVTDYFSLRPDLGSEQQLKRLIKTAKGLGMHVIFDFVPNHTSVHHPYVQDGIKFGPSSHYYDFYQHSNDDVLYSSNYHFDQNKYVYYFWKDLVNLNYGNEEVQQWMIEACKYWVTNFDIDGYRFDAAWGMNARAPLFGKRLRSELKSIKPDLLLLAEDKGSDKRVYDAGFDFAFDWVPDTSWVSHWSWQYDYDPKDNLTIFNFSNPGKRGSMLRKALFQHNQFMHRTLHFIENNDLPRFIDDHGLARTKMAAALLFSLPGLPLLYCGQEVGFQSKLYSPKPVFQADTTIRSLDHDSLFEWYQKLIYLRHSYGALRDQHIREIPVAPSNTVVAFTREDEENSFIIIINLGTDSSDAVIDLNANSKLVYSKHAVTYTDVLTGDVFHINTNNASGIKIQMPPYTTRWLVKDEPLLLISNRYPGSAAAYKKANPTL